MFSKSVEVLLGVACAVCGIVLAVMTVRLGYEAVDAQASRTWPTAEGKITSSGINEDWGSGRKELVLSLRYAYTVEGTPYECERVSFKAGDPEEAASRYSTGKKVTVHYDPSDPAQAVLEPGDLMDHAPGVTIVGFLSLFCVVGAFLVPKAWRHTLGRLFTSKKAPVG